MKWLTQYSKKDIPFTCAGDRYEWTWKEHIDKNGVLQLVHDKQKDLYAEIQSHADSVDLKILIARYENGDPSALNQRQAQYQDIMDLPKSLADCLNKVIETEQYFNAMPVDFRQHFNHSASQFAAQLGTEEYSAFVEKYKEEHNVGTE